jgi:hypothetical protein
MHAGNKITGGLEVLSVRPSIRFTWCEEVDIVVKVLKQWVNVALCYFLVMLRVIMTLWKIVQRHTYDLVSHKYSVIIILISISTILVSIIQFGEVSNG